MKKYPVGWRYYFFLVFFTSVTLLGVMVICMLLSGAVSDNGEEMSSIVAVVLSILIGAVLSTYAITAYRLLTQLIKFQKSAVTITHNGIENTLVFINLLAFVIVTPVKLIPWEAVTYFDTIDNAPYIRVNTKLVKAGWFAKLLLFILGYHFCLSFVNPQVQTKDIAPYQSRFNLKDNSLL